MRHVSSNSFRTVDEVVAEAADLVGDADIRQRTQGWYRARIKTALQELAIDTSYSRQYAMVAIPANAKGVVPLSDSLSISALHTVWVCQIDPLTKTLKSSRRVYPKTGIPYTDGAISDYTAKNNPNLDKDYHTMSTILDDRDALFYVLVDGTLYLYGAYGSATHVRVDYSGYGHDITKVGDAAIVPLEVSEAVIGFVAEKYWQSRMGESPNLAPMYDRAVNALYGMRDGRMSVWDRAQRRITASSPDEIRTALHNWRR